MGCSSWAEARSNPGYVAFSALTGISALRAGDYYDEMPESYAPPILIWFRRDLRVQDNAALMQAAAKKAPLLAVYIFAPEEEKPWQPGEASLWWLHHSLAALAKSLGKLGVPLLAKRGPSAATLIECAEATGAKLVMANDLPEPHLQKRDAAVAAALRKRGITLELQAYTHLLHAPSHLPGHGLNGQGKPYQVFTPFYKARLTAGAPPQPEPAPKRLPPYALDAANTDLARFAVSPKDGNSSHKSVGEHSALHALGLLPRIPWYSGFMQAAQPGEAAAQQRLQNFLRKKVEHYADDRDFPDRDGVSRLSPHLHFGEISPRQAWWAVAQAGLEKGAAPWIRQLWWREFALQLLHHFPHTPQEPLREAFNRFPWRRDPKALRAWQTGKTGYPLVDAGMRELWATGSMHNRVRMVVGSFLVKHLLQPWQEGACWFWNTLTDADLANNTLGWQWVAGCGADAAPYFRIFHPVTQSEKFDPDGAYIRRWVPELAKLPKPSIHKPWEAPPLELAAAGITLGRDYPHPIIDHRFARERALAAYYEIAGGKKEE